MSHRGVLPWHSLDKAYGYHWLTSTAQSDVVNRLRHGATEGMAAATVTIARPRRRASGYGVRAATVPQHHPLAKIFHFESLSRCQGA
jgi:hypothetical protein